MRPSLIAAVLVTATGCGTSAATSGGSEHASHLSGIRGVVTVGPVCPVQAAERPCRDHPLPAAATVTRSGSDRVVKSVTTGGSGRFSFTIQPGRYLVTFRAKGELPGAGVQQQVVTVQRGRFSELAVRFDSGIR
jgi:hypothetical protein